ncbi:Chondroitin 4-sulfotransferase [Oopsacas minuta]|uniref:Carbohydrate sulfotransferase n=1 Tax=Oopsacas minuta TaxID=111878 RepID=A0AAV7KK19_9METZ|nr:Chondroitin 4-sulfotransferase [Oopsacas minuta]
MNFFYTQTLTTPIENTPKISTHPPKIKNKNMTAILNNSPWIEYRNNWKGKIVIVSDMKNKKIILPNQYVITMEKKGPHPLTQVYPKFLDRINSVNDNCAKLTHKFTHELNLGSSIYSLHFNADYEVVRCLVPKATSHIWTKKFGDMMNTDHHYTNEQIRQKVSVTNHFQSPLDTARRMQTYTKFFIYRHPFERLISGFCDKFAATTFTTQSFLKRYGKQIIKINYLKNYKISSINELDAKYPNLDKDKRQEIIKQIDRMNLPILNYNLTFLEFVTFVTDSLNIHSIDKLNIHWKPVSRLCNPCSVHYDIIIDHDFVTTESQLLVDYLQQNKETNRPIYFEPYQRLSTREKCNQYFRDIPNNIRLKLYEVYRDDFTLFRYSYNGASKEFACEENRTD